MLAQEGARCRGCARVAWLEAEAVLALRQKDLLLRRLAGSGDLSGVIAFPWSEVGGLVLFLLVHSNVYVAVSVRGGTSWTTLPTPFPALPGTCAPELGAVAASAGRSLPPNRTVGRRDP